MDDLKYVEVVDRIQALELSVDRLRATIAQMNKHLGKVTIKANEGARLSGLVARAFEFSLMEIQELRRDVNSASEGVQDDS